MVDQRWTIVRCAQPYNRPVSDGYRRRGHDWPAGAVRRSQEGSIYPDCRISMGADFAAARLTITVVPLIDHVRARDDCRREGYRRVDKLRTIIAGSQAADRHIKDICDDDVSRRHHRTARAVRRGD